MWGSRMGLELDLSLNLSLPLADLGKINFSEPVSFFLSFFFLSNLFIYFIFGCVGSSLH